MIQRNLAGIADSRANGSGGQYGSCGGPEVGFEDIYRTRSSAIEHRGVNGWLRAILAQRRVNQYKKIGREVELGAIEPAAQVSEQLELKQIEDLRLAIKMTLSATFQEERFLLSAYYLDQRTCMTLAALSEFMKPSSEDTWKRCFSRATLSLTSSCRRVQVNSRLEFPDSARRPIGLRASPKLCFQSRFLERSFCFLHGRCELLSRTG